VADIGTVRSQLFSVGKESTRTAVPSADEEASSGPPVINILNEVLGRVTARYIMLEYTGNLTDRVAVDTFLTKLQAELAATE